MKKIFAILIVTALMALSFSVNAQIVFTVGYYNEDNGTIATLCKNGERLYTAYNDNQFSKATRVACNSQGDVYWYINFYNNSDGSYNHAEIYMNDQVYATNEDHRDIHITDMFCLNDTLYYTGYRYNEDSVMVATIWKGSDFVTHWTLGDGVHPSYIYDVDVDKRTGVPYFCGYVINEKKKAAVWEEQNLLSTFDQDSIYEEPILFSYATEIAVGDGHYYTVGLYEEEFPIPTVWMDNTVSSMGASYTNILQCICAFENTYYYGCIDVEWDMTVVLKPNSIIMMRLGPINKILSTVSSIYVIGKDFYNNFCVWKDFEKQYQIEGIDAINDACVFDPIIVPDSEWYYEIENEDGTITYQHLEYTADTTIGTERPKVIVRSNTQYDRDEHTNVTHEYILEDNGKVYWWNKELEEFTVLYDLAANAGDEWEIKVGTQSLVMHVDTVRYVENGDRSFRVLQVSDSEGLFCGDIVCGIGHMTSFFPERLMRDTEGFRVNGLRCYWVGDELIYHEEGEDCDAVYAVWHEGIEEDGPSTPSTGSGTLVVYPNPAEDVLVLETQSIASLQAETYRITNVMGQTLMTGTITPVETWRAASLQRIDISGLPAGMYFITAGGQTVKFVKR